MREIIILSGKGGTGKTSLTGALAQLADHAIICDLDVDAPDLHLLLNPDRKRREAFFAGHEAVIAAELCSGCGTCASLCQFGAVRQGEDFQHRPLAVRGLQGLRQFLPGSGHTISRTTLRHLVCLGYPLRPPGPCPAFSRRGKLGQTGNGSQTGGEKTCQKSRSQPDVV